ncbi:molybdopterin adenylyltransferase [Aequitasia blattaphilus]|uniref:Molybdopterin-binding protein n=1 Tax=Aequitasia blattaphilus TaxID=2949332 RepID=A0ABT1EC71_9FIRM|nr:MOSC domain-containing protein [Aequitasia blattaphilus]MCP1102097.1 molybdopterin-binding protein [Aequitasia blattaphilus]MCR8614737.1 molybdopterin-binding protein [Aequitasia blattaphilus]
MGKVLAVCRSEKKGTQKMNIGSGFFKEGFGLEQDAHGGSWHRQVSLISGEKIEAFKKKGVDVVPGAFGENLIVEGIDFKELPVGTHLRCNEVLLEMTQIGKECHTHCQIYHKVGDCIMPREGVFARVLHSGIISVGDTMEIEEPKEKQPLRAAVITLSDKGARGEREDKSGPAIANRLRESGYEVIEEILIPDDEEELKRELIRLCDQRRPQLILTTGGTGFSPRDITPEATLLVGDKEAQGVAEAIRYASMQITKRGMLSRGRAVIRKETLIVNLPGSPKACMESMDAFLDTIEHGLELLQGKGGECASV